jgi:AcrR family transcriptional regulator
MSRSIWTVEPRGRTTTTRERILDAAVMLFYEHGFHAIGLDQILEEVGVTKTTFYNHFPSKDDLIVAALDDRDQHDMEALEEELARRGGGPRDRILAVFEILDQWLRDPDFKGCLFINAGAQFPNPNDPIHKAAERHAENVNRAFEQFAREAGAERPEALAKQLCMLVAAVITARQVSCDYEAGETAREMAVALLDRFIGPA